MKAIKKRISVLLAGLMLAGTVGTTFNVKAEGVAVPNPKFITTSSYVVSGEAQSIFVTTKFEGKVQYNVWYQDAELNWYQTGYGEAVDASVPTKVDIEAKATTGRNAVVIWAKRAEVDQKDAANTKVIDGETVGYDSVSYSYYYAQEDSAKVYEMGDIDYKLDGNKLTVNGVKGAKEGVGFNVFLLDVVTMEWTTVRKEFSTDAVSVDVEPGRYYLDVQVNDPEFVREGETADKWDAWRLVRLDVAEKAGKEVAFETSVKALNFGGNITVSSDSDAVATYRVFKDGAEVTYDAVAINETAKDLYPLPEAGEMVTVKFYDAAGAMLAETEVALGEAGKVVIEEKEMEEIAVEATVKALNFGGNITVTCENDKVATYRVFKDGEEVTYDAVAINEAAKDLYPLPKAGEEVVVKLYDAAGALIAETTTALK